MIRFKLGNFTLFLGITDDLSPGVTLILGSNDAVLVENDFFSKNWLVIDTSLDLGILIDFPLRRSVNSPDKSILALYIFLVGFRPPSICSTIFAMFLSSFTRNCVGFFSRFSTQNYIKTTSNTLTNLQKCTLAGWSK